MSRSVLLQLARNSIEEVFQAQKSIHKEALLKLHPLLHEKIPLTINIFINKKLRGSYSIKNGETSLLSNIIIASKKAVFEGEKTLTTSEYLHSEIEVVLETPEGEISERDKPILSLNFVPTLNKTSDSIPVVKS